MRIIAFLLLTCIFASAFAETPVQWTVIKYGRDTLRSDDSSIYYVNLDSYKEWNTHSSFTLEIKEEIRSETRQLKFARKFCEWDPKVPFIIWHYVIDRATMRYFIAGGDAWLVPHLRGGVNPVRFDYLTYDDDIEWLPLVPETIAYSFYQKVIKSRSSNNSKH